MKIKIEIECDTIGQIGQHLRKVGEDIRKEAKRQKLNLLEDEFEKRQAFNDDNCYGEHTCRITPSK